MGRAPALLGYGAAQKRVEGFRSDGEEWETRAVRSVLG